MKLLWIASLLLATMTTGKSCTAKKALSTCFRGKLEVKGMCSNYTIKLLEGNMDMSLLSARWQDENTGKTHTKVFALDNPCTFPAGLNEGDEFYFTIEANPKKDCTRCMAYYPTPNRKLSIKVVPSCF